MKTSSGKTLTLFARVMAAVGMAEGGDFDTARDLMATSGKEETSSDRNGKYWSLFRVLHQGAGSK